MEKSSLKMTHAAVLSLLLMAAFVELLRTAWMSDDAAITLRTVLNLTHDYGARFNIDERVQAYTHPFWFLLISALSLVFGNVYTADFLLSFLFSLLTLGLLVACVASEFWLGIVAATVLLLSKAYVEFSTSGLENPLSHFLIIMAVVYGISAERDKSKSAQLGCLLFSSLLYLSRPDLLLLIAPFCGWILYKTFSSARNLFYVLAIAAVPIVLWTAFSIFYYGFPFPNTAYAKLGTGITLSQRIPQGITYVSNFAVNDPLSAIAIILGFAASWRGSRADQFLAAGCLAYILYVVSIGGDFMFGRFFTAPLLVMLIVFSRANISPKKLTVLAALFLALGAVNLNSTILSGPDFGKEKIMAIGIIDERAYFYQSYNMAAIYKDAGFLPAWQAPNNTINAVSKTCGGLGFIGIRAGASTHVIDTCALADPLLARLPAEYISNWRPGHFVRQLPTDYADSIANGENLLKDPATKTYYESIRTITRGPLFDSRRLGEIVRMNLGRVPKPDLDYYKYQKVPPSSQIPSIPISELQKQPVDSGNWDAKGNVVFEYAIDVMLPKKLPVRSVDISLDHNDVYRFEILSEGKYIPFLQLGPDFGRPAGMVRYSRTLEQPTAPTDRVRITVLQGDGMYSIGHFWINSEK